jgi:signal peptidase
VLRFVRIVVTSFVVTVLTGLLLILTIPTFFGYRNMVVLSGSMEPTIHTGDIVISRGISPLRAHVGDVVTFRDPAADRLISHRVRSMHVYNGSAHFVTKGDASNAVQKWQVPVDGRIGRVDLRLSRLGYVLGWVTTRWGRMLLVVVPALLLGTVEVVRIWRPRKKDEGASDATHA